MRKDNFKMILVNSIKLQIHAPHLLNGFIVKTKFNRTHKVAFAVMYHCLYIWLKTEVQTFKNLIGDNCKTERKKQK